MAEKNVQDMRPQELLKMFVKDVGVLLDARIRTAEITIKASTDAAIKAAKEELRADIKGTEKRLTKRLETLEQKMDTRTEDNEKHIKSIEEHIGFAPKTVMKGFTPQDEKE